MNENPGYFTRRRIVVGASVALASGTLFAHGAEPHGAKATKSGAAREQTAWGVAGERRQVVRTVRIDALDTMRFKPDRLEIIEGQTLRIVVTNRGRMMHELVIGTKEELDQHAEQMLKHPNMEHDEPHMAHVPPGGRGEIIWRFNRTGKFMFACLIAGHYQAGMIGHILVRPRSA